MKSLAMTLKLKKAGIHGLIFPGEAQGWVSTLWVKKRVTVLVLRDNECEVTFLGKLSLMFLTQPVFFLLFFFNLGNLSAKQNWDSEGVFGVSGWVMGISKLGGLAKSGGRRT